MDTGIHLSRARHCACGLWYSGMRSLQYHMVMIDLCDVSLNLLFPNAAALSLISAVDRRLHWILMRVHPLFMRASLIVAPNVQLGVTTPGGAKCQSSQPGWSWVSHAVEVPARLEILSCEVIRSACSVRKKGRGRALGRWAIRPPFSAHTMLFSSRRSLHVNRLGFPSP